MATIMHSPVPNVLRLFGAPSREDAGKAISLCLLRIHANHEGLTWDAIAKALDCHVDTVASARDEKHLLGFEVLVRIGYFFPNEFAVVEALWRNHGAEEPTIEERRDRIVSDLDAILRERAV